MHKNAPIRRVLLDATTVATRQVPQTAIRVQTVQAPFVATIAATVLELLTAMSEATAEFTVSVNKQKNNC